MSTDHTHPHRHHGNLEGLEPHADRRAVVRIRASAAWAACPAGQHTLWMLANLLARQFNLVAGIEFDVPEAPCCPHVAHFGTGTGIRGILASAVRAISPGKVHAGPPSDRPPDMVLVIGDTDSSAGIPSLSVAGEGFRACLGASAAAMSPSARTNPIGPYFAACLAAGEVFKRLRGLRPGAGVLHTDLSVSLWDHADSSALGLEIDNIHFPPAYVVGIGAVGQAVLATFASIPGATGHLTLIDQDPVDDTNLNRYALSVESDCGREKVEVVAERLALTRFTVFPAAARWERFISDPSVRAGQPMGLAMDESAYRYERVLCCVDKNTARHGIQNYSPRHLFGGSTSGMTLAVAAYDATTDYECLKCHNPKEPAGHTIEQIAEALRGLTPEERETRARAAGVDPRTLEEYLKDPRCGRLGEADVLKFDDATLPDWSVGFVSVAAGVMLAAEWVKHTLGRASLPSPDGNTCRFWFLNGVMRRTRHGRNPACDCLASGVPYHRALWASAPRA